MSQYFRLPRKLKKKNKKAQAAINAEFERRLAEETRVLEEHGTSGYLTDLIQPRVGDTVLVGKGKTEWQITAGYTDKLVLLSAAGRKKYVPRTDIDTLTVVK